MRRGLPARSAAAARELSRWHEDRRDREGDAARRRFIPGTASCRRTRRSPRCARAQGSSSSARLRRRSRRWARSPRRRRSWTRRGVPLVPGYHGDDQDPALLAREAERDRLSGPDQSHRGRRRQGHEDRAATSREFAAALASAQREAKASFGDDRVLIERYLTSPRHIEIQVFADTHGNAVHLFERDCSVQRRHQKVLEEAPAPGMTPRSGARRWATPPSPPRGRSATSAPGTVEFIAEQDGRFYFMEMNTRLQVEHPVTEMITGLDLVEWQLRVAAGEPLPLRAARRSRCAVMRSRRACTPRIPARGFLPSIGRIVHWRMPRAGRARARRHGVSRRRRGLAVLRSDARQADRLGGGSRPRLRGDGSRRCGECEVAGVATNIAFLRARRRARGVRDARSWTRDSSTSIAMRCSPPPATRRRACAHRRGGCRVRRDRRARATRCVARRATRIRHGTRSDGWWPNRAPLGIDAALRRRRCRARRSRSCPMPAAICTSTDRRRTTTSVSVEPR